MPKKKEQPKEKTVSTPTLFDFGPTPAAVPAKAETKAAPLAKPKAVRDEEDKEANKGVEIKDAIVNLHTRCFFFKHKLCYVIGSAPEPCTGTTHGTVCAQFVSYRKSVCDRYKNKPVTYHDVVDWESIGRDETTMGRQTTIPAEDD